MKRSDHRRRLNKKLAAYSAMAAGVVGVSEPSQAAVTVFNDINAVVDASFPFRHQVTYVDIDGMSTATTNAGAEFGVGNFRYGFSTPWWMPTIWVPDGSAMNGLSKATLPKRHMPRMSASQTIGPSRNFDQYRGPFRTYSYGKLFYATDSSDYLDNNDTQPWSPGDTGFIGFRIDLGGGDFQYGWAQIQVDAVFQGDVTILAAAIETDPNTPIHIPESGTLSLLALGAAGVSALKRRKAETA